MDIAVIGVGYVGLTTAACLASLGHDVVAADVVEEKVKALAAGVIPIVEEGLEDLVRAGLDARRLHFVLGAEQAVEGAEVVFLCVPTPQGADGAADMSFVQQAASTIGPLLRPNCVIVNKSTVPVGSTRVVEQAVRRADIDVVSNPEFLREGTAVRDWLHPDRIVIGADRAAAADRVAALFDGIDAPILVTDPPTAETIKYAANAFLATKVSFVNAVANVCEAVHADVRQVMAGMGLDPRIGDRFLQPGPGWGGSCFPKDSEALVRIAADAGYDFSLLRGVIEVNRQQHDHVVRRVQDMVGGTLTGLRIGLWGLTYKAGTDDLRDSPAIEVALRLVAKGAEVVAYDPTLPISPGPGIDVVGSAAEAATASAAVVVLTEWPEFATVDWMAVADVIGTPRVFDARQVVDVEAAEAAGFTVGVVGRPPGH